MFWFVVYFMVSCGGVVLVLAVLRHFFKRFKVTGHRRVFAYAVVLLIPFVPYVRVAVQTALYKDELLPAFRAGTAHIGEPNDPILIFRVLDIRPSRAEVYVVNPCRGGSDAKNDKVGWVMRLTRAQGKWRFASYDTVWSDCGSAEGNTFPPYPEAKSF